MFISIISELSLFGVNIVNSVIIDIVISVIIVCWTTMLLVFIVKSASFSALIVNIAIYSLGWVATHRLSRIVLRPSIAIFRFWPAFGPIFSLSIREHHKNVLE